MNFWQQLEKPILALAPMDGVTDAAYRYITAKHGSPDIHFTEFTNVEGLARNAAVMLTDFIYSETERPVVAQIYGSEVESFYKIAIVVCELGFDGIDINMGCPAKKVAARGCGAGLIRTPELAKDIVRAVKQGVVDWVNGKSIEDLGFKLRMKKRVEEMNVARIGAARLQQRRTLPISVKTRIGYDSVVVEDWVKHLLEVEPVAISIHGRTLKQMYTGQADWEAIARAAELIHQTDTLVLGNGDLNTVSDVVEKLRLSQVDGVLLGRGSMGNPWIFSHKEEVRNILNKTKNSVLSSAFPSISEPDISAEQRFAVLLEHARYFEQVKGRERFSAMRKHFGWYCKGMPQASLLRNRMCQTKSSEEVAQVLQEYRREVLG